MTSERLYPELAEHGSLAGAIQATAAWIGIDLGVVEPAESVPRHGASIVSTAADRRPLTVGLGAVERWFLISGWSRGVQLVSGATTDLTEIVRAASAWREGASLDELQAAAPFVKVDSLARAHEQGPAEAVAEQWRLLRLGWASDVPVAAVIEAAYANPVLRQLFPYTSHMALLFSTCTGYPYSQGIPVTVPRAGGGYIIYANGDPLGEVDEAESAVALVLGNLPADVGPAVAGNHDDTSR
jgi:hypothetical protein